MNSTQQSAIAHYMSKGLSKDVAIGIISVLMVESALNPLAENNSGTDTGGVVNPKGAYGLAQWNGPRQQALANYATTYSKNVSDINTQLDFVLTEAANSYPDFWKAITSPATHYQDLITVMVDTYEVPADKAGEITKAVAYGADMYANYSTPAPTPVPAPVSSTAGQITITLKLTNGNITGCEWTVS